MPRKQCTGSTSCPRNIYNGCITILRRQFTGSPGHGTNVINKVLHQSGRENSCGCRNHNGSASSRRGNTEINGVINNINSSSTRYKIIFCLVSANIPISRLRTIQCNIKILGIDNGGCPEINYCLFYRKQQNGSPPYTN